jgi:hypothetical protein
MTELKLSNIQEIGYKETRNISTVRTVLNSTKGFKYDPINHTYTINGIKLISTTELISKYVKPFDTAMISELSAKKYSREGHEKLGDAKAVRQYWKLLGEHAAGLGTTGHIFCKLYWLNRDIKPITQLDINAKKAMDAILHKFDIVEMEVPRGSSKYLIGYTLDIILRDKISGEIVIGDFKFSSKFNNEQYKKLKGRNAGLLEEPFKDFRDVAYDKGSIQLEMYKKFLKEDLGINVTSSILIHIDGLGEESFYGDKGYKSYFIKDCSKEVESILKPFESNESIVNLL